MVLGKAPHFWRLVYPRGREAMVRTVLAHLAEREFDAIAVKGVSGVVAGSIVAYLTGKPLLIVREDGTVDAYCDMPWSYIILDDLVDSGTTIKFIRRTIKKHIPNAGYKGTYQYIYEEWF